MKSYNIGVTGTGSLVGQAIIKCIRDSALKSDIHLVGFDYFPETVGSYWVDEHLLLPDFLAPAISEDMWLEKLIDIIRDKNIRLLFIGVDFELPLFAKFRQRINAETGCEVFVSDERIIRIGNDKYLTYEYLRDHDFYHPLTYLPGDIGPGLKFPCMVKPRVGTTSRGVYKVDSLAELNEKLPGIKDPVVQELIGNMETEYTCGVVFMEGELKARIALRRKLKIGHTFEAFHDHATPPVIYEYISEVAHDLQPFGACNFQLRLDDKGIPKIFEINPRHSGTTYIRSLFGYNEIELIIRLHLGMPVEPFALKEGKVIRYFDEMFVG